MTRPIAGCSLVLLLLTLGIIGCGDGQKTAELVPTEVVVTINNQPLPNALVTLTPTAEGYGSSAIAFGVTDEKGRAKLMCGSKEGACIGTNLVTVADAPPPEDTRGEDAAAQIKGNQYLKGLKNRPIPEKYMSVSKSDLKIEIQKGQTEYTIDLKR